MPTAQGSTDVTGGTPVRIVVADDHPLVLSGIRQLFTETTQFALVGVAATGRDAVAICAATMPGLLLLDLRLPDLPAPAVCQRVRAASPATVIAVWSAQPDAMALRNCLRAGAMAFLVKDVTERDLLGLLWQVAARRVVVDPRMAAHLITVIDDGPLSLREREVLILMARGLTTSRIAEHLGISANTVKTHRHALLAKLGARNRVEALLIAERRGLLGGEAA